jgi:hypothetical protein
MFKRIVNRIPSFAKLQSVLVVIAIVLTARAGTAQVFFTNDDGDGQSIWNLATNWSPEALPTTADEAFFPSFIAGGGSGVDFSISIANSGTLNQAAVGTLTIACSEASYSALRASSPGITGVVNSTLTIANELRARTFGGGTPPASQPGGQFAIGFRPQEEGLLTINIPNTIDVFVFDSQRLTLGSKIAGNGGIVFSA